MGNRSTGSELVYFILKNCGDKLYFAKMIYFLFLLSLVILGLYIIWWRMIAHLTSGLKSLRGPQSLPFLGGLGEIFPVSECLWKLMKLTDTYGRTYMMTCPYTTGIITKEPDFIEFIMTSTICIDKGYIYKFFNNWLREGLLLSRGQKWRLRRKMLTPTFHFKILEEFVEVFHKNELTLIELLEKASTKGPVDIYKFVTLCALDNINETAMGTSVNAQLNSNSEFVNATKLMTRVLFNRAASPYKFMDFTYAFSRDFWRERKALKVLHGYTLSVINARRESLLKNGKIQQNNNKTNEDDLGIKKRIAFLDLLLNATIDGQPLSIDDIREEVDTFMFEGHDTVSAGISFALHCISKHPEIQARLIEEQRSILGNDPKKMVTLEDMREMTYLEMVIKEALRLFPSVPIISRMCSADFQYKNITVRKGTELIIAIFEAHRDERLYPDPLKFDPERFNFENQSKRHPFSYLPFSAGHRNCIGQKFAIAEMKSMISCIIREFELIPTDHELNLPSAVVLFSTSGVNMQLKKRIW